jgi:hypothetical protein
MMATTTSSPVAGIIFGVIFVAIVGGATVLAIRRREIVFDGEVIDKNIVENSMPVNDMGNMNHGGINLVNGGGIKHDYYINVRTSSGKTIKYKISSGMYEIVKIGDMVSKPKGTTEITITSSKTPTVTATPPQVISPTSPQTNTQVTPASPIPATTPPTSPASTPTTSAPVSNPPTSTPPPTV